MKEISLPEGWVGCAVGDYLFLKNGYAFKSKDYIEQSKDSFPIIRISDLDGLVASDKTAVHVMNPADGFEVINGDLLIAMSGATTGKIGVYEGSEPAYQNQRVGNLKLQSDIYGDVKYRNYLIQALTKKVLDIAYGGAQPNISGKAIESIDIKLPPLAEQKVIADKLDTMLAQVETTKARLENTLEILKQFRQSVLAAAVSGKLTEAWRGNNGISMGSWTATNIGALAQVATGKTPKRTNSDFWSNGDVPWLTSAVTGNPFTYNADQFVTKLAVKECTLKVFPIGTLLLAMYGEGKTRGQVTEIQLEATCNQACAAILVNENKVNRAFLKIRLQENYEETRKVAAGGAQPNLNLDKVRAIPVYLPSSVEQTEIVRRVESLFAQADSIEQQTQAALDKVNNLTQSILAKAFRGELTEQWRKNNPDLISGENSAEALLDKIKAEREAMNPKKPQARKKS